MATRSRKAYGGQASTRGIELMRRTGVLLMTALLVSAATVARIGPSAGAATPAPPMTGNVACALDGSSTFTPYLGYAQSLVQPRINPGRDSKWKLLADLTGCTGTQTGGHPKKPGPIVSGEVLARAFANDHECQKATDDGLTLTRLRIKWNDAQGRNLATSIGTGHVAVEGLFDGWPYTGFDFPPTVKPEVTPPGVITLHGTGTIAPTSKVFPGSSFAFTAVADETLIDDFLYVCSYGAAQARRGVTGFAFTGERGASSLSVG